MMHAEILRRPNVHQNEQDLSWKYQNRILPTPERNMHREVQEESDGGCQQQAAGRCLQAIDRIASRADFFEESVYEDIQKKERRWHTRQQFELFRSDARREARNRFEQEKTKTPADEYECDEKPQSKTHIQTSQRHQANRSNRATLDEDHDPKKHRDADGLLHR